MVISNSRPDDSGVYECRAVEAGANPAVSRATLSVQPDPRTDSSKPINTLLETEANIHTTCGEAEDIAIFPMLW